MERFRLEQKVLFRGKCLEGNLLVVLVISQKLSLVILPLVYFQKISENIFCIAFGIFLYSCNCVDFMSK